MNAWFRGRSIPCPNCGSRDVKLYASPGRLGDGAAFCAPRFCNACQTVFEPPVSAGEAFVAIGFGLLMLVFAIDSKVPLLYAALIANEPGSALGNAGMLLLLLGYGLHLMILGRMALRRKETRIVH